MKTVRIVLASLAITIASVSVFANSLVATTFYRSSLTYTVIPTNPNAVCFQQISITGCEGTGAICTADAPGDTKYIISKIVSPSTTCELTRKN